MSENQRPDRTESGAANEETAPASQDPLQEAQQEAEKLKNDLLYLRAEFENYKRHAVKERSDLLKYGSERLLIDILGVLDNFERALETRPSPETLQQYVKGVEMTATELRSVLQKFGISEIASLGQNFDPSLHEALSSEETDQFQAGHISRVFKKPYRLHERIIRPGQVVVAKKPSGL